MHRTAPNVEEIFLAALEIEAPEARSSYLDEACGHTELRHQVERLLALDARAGGFLERPAAAPTGTITAAPIQTEAAGTVIGPYKLMEQIGEGGMGVVYVAEQSTPVRRKVALKIIKPGMDTKQVVARFEAERQALAMMDHPNIASVHDGGTTESGRPYFVMELVRGLPINEYCDREQLTITERLELFVLVCRAVQHAHQKGVIHRDLKPSNILVTVIDGAAVPKVIDFGVAKATGASLTERTIYTAFHQFVGTPLYMSPEQADLAGVDVDTRSDIYSLGVLLYELLTGMTPFDQETFRTAAFDEMRRMIREDDPPRPSTRLSALKLKQAALSTLCERRGADQRKLGRQMRGELDWIVMKALEKDRDRRYESASAFAADVQRYLNDEPVSACPPTPVQRARKWSRRHPSIMASALVALVLAVIALSVSNLLIRGANRQKDRALQEKEGALRTAEEAKAAAQQSETETRAVLEFVEKKVFAAARPKGEEGGMGREVPLREALEAALPFVAKNFSGQPLVEARLRRTLGLSFRYLGDEDIAARQFETARTLYAQKRGPDHADTLTAANNLANSYAALGRQAEALKLRQETLALRKAKLGPDHPDTLKSMNNLATSFDALGRHADALKLREETLALRKAKLGSDDPETLASMNNLAISYTVLGRHPEAVKLREETLALLKARHGPDHPRTLAAMHNLAESYQALGRYAEAESLYEETLALARAQLGPIHPKTLLVMNSLAWLLCTAEDAAFRNPARAVELAAKAAECSPKNAEFLSTLGTALYRAGDWKKATVDLEKAISLRSPDDSQNANESFFLAMAFWRLGDRAGARIWFDKAVAWMEKDDSRHDELGRFKVEAARLLGIEQPAFPQRRSTR